MTRPPRRSTSCTPTLQTVTRVARRAQPSAKWAPEREGSSWMARRHAFSAGRMRSVSSWVGHEQVHFRGVTLLKRALTNCPIWPRTAEGLKAFHRDHILRARDALRGAKCAIEVDLGRPAEETAERLATVFPGTNRSCWNVVKPSPCGSEGRFSLTPCSEARRKQAMKAKIHRRARG